MVIMGYWHGKGYVEHREVHTTPVEQNEHTDDREHFNVSFSCLKDPCLLECLLKNARKQPAQHHIQSN